MYTMRFDFSVLDSCTEVYFTYIFQKYLKDMQAYFGAEPQSVNFVGASGQIRTEINSWVESQTEGKLSSRAELRACSKHHHIYMKLCHICLCISLVELCDIY